MAYLCYRATVSECKNCPHCRFDPERGENACFGGQETPDEDQYYNFLEWLRRSGIVNMYGATTYLYAEFDELSLEKAGEFLDYWMSHYGELSEKYGWNKEEK